jgi:hypothetical protein
MVQLPQQLFRLIPKRDADSVTELGLPAYTTLVEDPFETWSDAYVGIVVHLANSGTPANRVGSSSVWVTQGHIEPEYVNIYTQEGR